MKTNTSSTVVIEASSLELARQRKGDDKTRLMAVYYRLANGRANVPIRDADAIFEIKRCKLWVMSDSEFFAYQDETERLIASLN